MTNAAGTIVQGTPFSFDQVQISNGLVGQYSKGPLRVDNKRNSTYTSYSGFTLAKGVDMNQLDLGVAVSF